MGCCLSRERGKEQVVSSIAKIAENTSQLVIIHRQLTSATCDLRRTYSDGVSSARELNSSQDNRIRALRIELAKIKGELREINNTCRIRNGGLPTDKWQRVDCETSDCESINSAHSNASIRCSIHQRPYPAARPRGSPSTRAVYENDRTLTRSSPVLTACAYDRDGYVLPTLQH